MMRMFESRVSADDALRSGLVLAHLARQREPLVSRASLARQLEAKGLAPVSASRGLDVGTGRAAPNRTARRASQGETGSFFAGRH
jgi:hypothetical protein